MLPLLIIPVYAQETQNEIPSWIKVVAGAWYNGEITDSEYKDAQEFLIENGIFDVDRVSAIPVAQVQETNVESEKDKEIKHLKNELQKLDTKQHELEKTQRENEIHYEQFLDHETQDWYDKEMDQLYQQLGEIPELKSWAASLEEENKNTADNNRELHNKINELGEEIRELKTKVIQLEMQLEIQLELQSK